MIIQIFIHFVILNLDIDNPFLLEYLKEKKHYQLLFYDEDFKEVILLMGNDFPKPNLKIKKINIDEKIPNLKKLDKEKLDNNEELNKELFDYNFKNNHSESIINKNMVLKSNPKFTKNEFTKSIISD